MSKPSVVRAIDLLTVAACGVIAYFVSALLHEGLGHAVVALAVGADDVRMSSSEVTIDSDVSIGAARAILVAGSAVNILTGALAALWLRSRAVTSVGTYLVWLFAAVSLFQSGGYMMVAPLADFGDWGGFTRLTFDSSGLPIIVVTVLGIGLSLLTLRWAVAGLRSMTQASANPAKLARRLTWVPYLVAGATSVATATLFGADSSLVASVLVSFGGTAWLVWAASFVEDPKEPEEAGATPGTALTIPRNTALVVLAVAIIVADAAVFAPGIGLN
jgi:putative Ca2+/H+ antiporter (TMEM165/GDT1 family)